MTTKCETSLALMRAAALALASAGMAACATDKAAPFDASAPRRLDPDKAYVLHSGYLIPRIDIDARAGACRETAPGDCRIARASLPHRHLVYELIETPPGRLRIEAFDYPSEKRFLSMFHAPYDIEIEAGRIHFLGNHVFYRTDDLKNRVIARQIRDCDLLSEIEGQFAFVCPRPVNFDAFVAETPFLKANAEAIVMVRYGRPVTDFRLRRIAPEMIADLANLREVVDFEFSERPPLITPYAPMAATP